MSKYGGSLQLFDFKPRGFISLDAPFSVDFSFGLGYNDISKAGEPLLGFVGIK